MFVLPIFVSHVSLVIFYERIKIILVKSYLNTPSAYLPKMYHNGKKSVNVLNTDCLISTHLWHVHSISPPLSDVLEREATFSLKFWKKEGVRKKITTEVFWKSPCHRYLLEDGTYYVFCQKDIIIKWNRALRAKFSNANLGLF